MIIERKVGVVACETRLGPRNQQTARLENFLPLLLLILLVFTPKKILIFVDRLSIRTLQIIVLVDERDPGYVCRAQLCPQSYTVHPSLSSILL